MFIEEEKTESNVDNILFHLAVLKTKFKNIKLNTRVYSVNSYLVNLYKERNAN